MSVIKDTDISLSFDDILSLFSLIIEQITKYNIDQPESTIYSSFTLKEDHPLFELSMEDYLNRITTSLSLDKETLILSMMLLDRFMLMNPLYHFTEKTMHKTIFLCIMETIKFTDDNGYTNLSFAEVGQFTPEELLEMEVCFMDKIEYNMFIKEEDYIQYQERLSKMLISWRLMIKQI